MRVAAIYDIHGNLPVLEAVLHDIRRIKVDRLVVGGDVVPGPMPREVLACLLAFDIPVQFIHGNGDRSVLEEMAGTETDAIPEHFREVIRWNAQQLHPQHEQLLASWPKTITLDIDDLGEVLFCHATPRSDTEIFTRLTPDDQLLPALTGVNVPVIICGHTHMQFDRTVGKIRVVNAGGVGMPYGEPGAYWLLIGPDIQLRHARYDLARAAERIRDTNYPQAQEFAANYVLRPLSEEKMLEKFTHRKLR
jgi:predicted phosphodiesterase